MDLPNNANFKAILFKTVIKISGDTRKSALILFQERQNFKWFQAQEGTNPVQSNLVKCRLPHTQPGATEQR